MESETIKFNEAEGRDGFVIKDDSTMIHIYPSRASQKVSNSKVKLTNFVDFTWDTQHGIGRLIASHYSGKFLAYCIKANVGAVRVVDLVTQDRVILKGTKGLIKDVEFMHKADDLVLGFIDEYGTFYVYKIHKDLKTDKMQTVMILQVMLEGSPNRLDCRRFIWCKFVPDELNDIATTKDFAYHFAIVEDDVVYVSNLVQLVQKFGEGTHTLPSFKGNYMTIDAHTASVVDASFSPDGTALATASKDGTVKFFQVYLVGDEVPRCLYSWAPHDGNPVSRIFFLDDHTLNLTSEAQYWKYMITAGPNGSELKLWTCKSWECIQAIRFCCTSPSTFKMDLNINANFVVLSDVHRKVMYVLHLDHDDTRAGFSWINEFSLPVNMIDFNVSEASFVNMRQLAERGFQHFVSEREGDEACMVDVILVQPKSLMQATVAFKPPTSSPHANGRSHSRISFDDSVSYKGEDEEEPREESEDDGEENIAPASETPKRQDRSVSRSPRSATRIPTPISASSTRIADKSPVRQQSQSPRRRSQSPRPPVQNVSVTQMTQQLSSLIGVTSGFGNNLTGSRSGSIHESQHHSPDYHGMNLGSEMPGPIRVRTSSDNGNISNASSSPSREVEQILSPKNAETMIHNKLDTATTGYNMGVSYAVNNLDIEGNILDARDNPLLNSPKSFHKLPSKVKSLGGGELSGGPQLPHVLEQVNSIMDMMKTQAQEMQELKREVTRLNNAQAVSARQLDEASLSRIMDKYLVHNQSCLQRMEETLTTSEKHQLQYPQHLKECMAGDIAKILKTEIESRVLPQLVKVFEPTKQQINGDIEKMVKAAESRVKQHMHQTFNSLEFKHSLIPDLTASLKSACDGVVTQVLTSSILPSFEKAMQSVFAKVNDTFMVGTKEYLGALEVSLNSNRIQSENSQEAIREQLTNMQDNLSSILQVELETHMMQVIGSLQGGVVKKIEESMSKELSRAFKDQQRYFEISVIPRTITPAVSVCDQIASPAVDPAALQRMVLGMVDSGDFVGAFVKASNSADTQLLMMIAERVRPSEVFTRALPSNIHLSIVQQMTTDLLSHTETKLAYLQTAVGSMNLNDSKVLKGLARIIPVFQGSVRNFVSMNPDSPLLSSVKLLEMAFIGIGNRLHQQQVTPTGRESGAHHLLQHSSHGQSHHHYMD